MSGKLVPLRLVNGGSPCAGRVEVYHDGKWGTVRDYGWDTLDEAVVCKELSCGAALSAPGGAHFGEGSDPIVTWNVRCRGNESALRDCPSQTWSHYSWSDYAWLSQAHDVGVICSGNVSVRLVNGGSPCAGRVEIYQGGQWGTIDGYSYDYGYVLTWDMKAAAVVCKELGCGDALSASRAQFGKGSGYVVTYNVRCRGSESALRDCHTWPWGHYYRTHANDAGVICSAPVQKTTISLKPDSRVFMRGETAEISCSGKYPGSKFSFFRDGELIKSRAAKENSNTATFTPSEISAGNYWCISTKHMDGRELTLPESERVGISVWDPLQKPTISLEPGFRIRYRNPPFP
ncbi:deleted in malignant brain tumors 1 protein-like [Callorhinchus milii]|uniref:deleted in malignant brain tumors 1 protein-like n=1 Tax=Callorhinchus milii TaxID=7868 RepID=UPI001C3FF0A8|nr:deleted in malignant brain tumors 1 protein-like [Callorhinchus milii]